MSKCLFLKDRIDESVEILRMYEPPEGYYLAFSGGKDSVVLLDMAKRAAVKFDAHYNQITAEPPELVHFIMDNFDEVSFEVPRRSMWELIPERLIPPTRLARYCCEELKERGGEGRVVLTGVKKSDSTKRRKALVHSCRKNGKVVVNPLLNWCDDEIWDYIRTEGLNYCKLYDEGFTRLGCIGCPFSGPKEQRRQFNRWPRYESMYLRAFGRMLNERKGRGLETSWDTPEDVMRWWLKEEK